MADTKTPKTPATRKAPVAPAVRVTEQMKKAALANKITAAELDNIANLAAALKTFLTV